jgi:hypothetical protein
VPEGTQRLTYQLRLALEPECLENPTVTARENLQQGADSMRSSILARFLRCWTELIDDTIPASTHSINYAFPC